MQIIWFAMLVGVAAFAAVTVFVLERRDADDTLISYVAVGAGALAIVASNIVPVLVGRQLGAKALTAEDLANPTEETAGKLAMAFQTRLIIGLAMLGLKMVPSYIEFFALKKAINAVGEEARNGANAAAIRKSFSNRATIDAIESVKPEDLEITKDSTGVIVSAAYRKEIPLVSNIGIYIDFSAVSRE